MQRGYWCHQSRSISLLTQNHSGPSRHLLVPVLSVMQGWLWSQKQPRGHTPKYSSELSRAWVWRSPGAVEQAWPLSPHPVAPRSPPAASAAVSASLCRQRGTRCSPPPLPGSWAPGPSAPEQHCPLPATAPPLSSGGNAAFHSQQQFPEIQYVVPPSLPQRRLQSLISSGLALALPHREVPE